MKLSETMQDLNLANGIILCKAGFTSGTVTYAEKGIKLVKLREATENNVVSKTV